MVWIFVSFQSSYFEFLTPKVMVLGCGVCGNCLGHEGRNLMKERSIAPPTMWGYSEMIAIYFHIYMS